MYEIDYDAAASFWTEKDRESVRMDRAALMERITAFLSEHVGIAVFEPYSGFGKLKGLQVEGTAEMVEPFSQEYLKLMEHRKIPVDAMKRLPQPMHLIKVVPRTYDYLDSGLKDEGYGSRQRVEE